MQAKILSAQEAVRLIPSGATVCIGGGGAGHAVPDRIMQALGEVFAEAGSPGNLTVIHPCGIGDAADRGLSHLARPGLIKRAVGGFWGNSLKMVELARTGQIEAYNFPQGVLSHLTRAVASGAPGVITRTGLHTFVDPRVEGGKLNQEATEDLVKLIEIEGNEYLFFPSPRIDVGLIRGSSIDCEGNLSMEEEVGKFAMLSIAQAVKRNRGLVIAQVKRVREQEHTPAYQVHVPAVFIDAVIVEPDQGMTFLSPWEPALIRRDADFEPESLTLTGIPRTVAKRAAEELSPGDFVNVGFGMADGVPIVAQQEGVIDSLIFMIEQGAVGGIPTTGLNFGAMYQPLGILDDGYQFDYFHGGGLDIAFLGFAQIDREGNVNSSKFGSHITGCGGFIDISQNARKVVFCGSFAVKGEVIMHGDRIEVTDPGKKRKFIQNVEQITFSGKYALERGQEVLYVTERAVFRLIPGGLRLEEIAPGVDLERDILAMMDFVPEIADDLKPMSPGFFSDQPLQLRDRFKSRGTERGDHG
ncbi:MAG: acyl CoA:acetate/3-ketoacid CoA transferase [Acidobacteriota bacterium]|nr:MAG: acyl CoA:acetate/3-ketoacid CoA transferase [Acidobacteriota bacterium]